MAHFIHGSRQPLELPAEQRHVAPQHLRRRQLGAGDPGALALDESAHVVGGIGFESRLWTTEPPKKYKMEVSNPGQIVVPFYLFLGYDIRWYKIINYEVVLDLDHFPQFAVQSKPESKS